MRRDEFKVENPKVIKEILNECKYGTLSIISENKPYGVGLNFVYFEHRFCFHGAKSGKKIEALKANPNASFLAIKEYSQIPSYFLNSPLACPATQFFASVHAFGKIEFIEDLEHKANILSAFMKKLQKEGKYKPIMPNALYNKMLKATAVFTLKPKEISLKMKVGQNVKKEQFQALLQKLKERGEQKDIQTIEAMTRSNDKK